MARREFPAPNAASETREQWSRDMRLRAIGAIAYCGGEVSSKELASLLGISPRGLRPVLVGARDGVCDVEIKDDGETYYRIRKSALRGPSLIAIESELKQ